MIYELITRVIYYKYIIESVHEVEKLMEMN